MKNLLPNHLTTTYVFYKVAKFANKDAPFFSKGQKWSDSYNPAIKLHHCSKTCGMQIQIKNSVSTPTCKTLSGFHFHYISGLPIINKNRNKLITINLQM